MSKMLLYFESLSQGILDLASFDTLNSILYLSFLIRVYIWMHLYFQVKGYFKISLHIGDWLIIGLFKLFKCLLCLSCGKGKTLGELMKEVGDVHYIMLL